MSENWGGVGVGNDDNGIEFQKLGSDIANSGSEYNFDVNIDTNAGKEEKTETVVRKKAVAKEQKKVQKKVCSEESGKEEVYNEAKTENPNVSVLGASVSTETDRDTCGLVATESININTCATVEKKKRMVKKKVVKLVRKKVVKKGPEKEKKKHPDEDLVNVGMLNDAEVQNSNRIEFSNPNSDIANTGASNLLEVQNHGSTVVEDTMKVEKGSPFYDASEGSERIKGSKNEVESCDASGVIKDATMADGIVLNEEMAALERRKRRKTELFVGGLDKNALEEDVRNAFQEVGEVVEVTVKMHEKTGNNKGFAFVRYASAADAKKAVERLDKIKICGKPCSVSFVKGNDTIFLGNIDKWWKNEDIVKLLQDVGVKKIDNVTVKTDPENPKRNCGFAFIEIETIREARTAFGLLAKKAFLGNRKIRVEWAKEVDEEEMHKVKTVYAEHLPVSWDEEKVKDHFEKFGEIENVVLARNLISSGRKDFAFVYYKTREAALKCIKEFTQEALHNEGSMVNLNVSLTKSTPKAKQVKNASTPVITISNQEKPNAAQTLVEPNRLISKGKSVTCYHDYNRVVAQPNQLRSMGESTRNHRQDRASTNDELVQLLREQATWKQPQTSSAAGSVDLDYSCYFPARKRQFPHMEDDPTYSNPRGYPRPRTESAFPAVNPSRLSPVLGRQSLYHSYLQSLSYPSEFAHNDDGYFQHFQTRRKSPSGGGGRVYRG